MDIESITNYIINDALILIPVLNILGIILKNISNNTFSDKYIPVALLIVSIIFTNCMMGFGVDAFIQGVLVTGASVFLNQLFKQYSKEE